MDEDKDDPMMYIDPEILQKELVISLPILNESDIEMMINGVDTSSEDSSSSSVEDEKDKPCFKRDQRRLTLLNNPNYGTILCFMEKFRSYINLKNYPLRIFEDNLLSEQEKISGRFMDFHLNLLKKIVPGKTGGRTEFVTSMTKFAYRFNSDDGEHLGEYGYAKARIDTKLRILKNLLELQFDRNQQLKTAVADKPSFDIRTKPFGRDRFGASYWLFTDVDGFVRLFRENIDANCTWINLAKNSQELENIIKILITDTVVRKKFPDWKFSYEPFNNLSSSNKFEGDYAPDLIDIEENSNIVDPSSPTAVLLGSTFIKTENVNLDPVVSLNRDMPSSPLISSFVIKDIETKKSSETTSDQESINSEEINPNRLSTSSSSDTRDEIDSWGFLPPINENEQEEESINQVTTDKNNNDDNNNIIDNTANNNNTDVDDTNDINSNNDTVHMNVDSDVNNNNTADDDTSNINVNNDTVHMIVDNDVNNNNTDEDTGTINTDKNANNNNIINNTDDNNNNTQVVLSKSSLDQGIKRKLVDYDDTGSESENGNGSENENVHENRKIEESSRDSPPTPPINRPSKNNADLPLALRRPRRRGASRFAELLSDSSSTNDSLSQISSKKKNIDGSWKQPTHLYKTNTRRGRPRNRRKKHDFSSTTSDDRQPSDDDDDDFSEEYAVKNTELDLLLNGDFLEEEDDDDDYLPRRTAKTVAQYHELAEIQTKSCSTCSKTDRPEFLLLCENCNDAYHLECITPELLSVPEDDWYCPLCEHKRLCEKLIEKLIVIQNEEKYFEMKRRLSVSKRRKRLTNVTVNVERYVKQPIKRISSTDEDKEDEIKPKPILNKNKKNIIDDDEDDDDDDDDSVYGRKNDENRKPSDHEDNEEQQSGKRRVRACRRKPQNYSLDDYDKKIKKAMIDAGINKELVENDSDDSDESVLKRRPAKKRARYEEDDDFDMSDTKTNDKKTVSRQRRLTSDSSRTIIYDSRLIEDDSQMMNEDTRMMNDDSRSDNRDNDFNDDFGMSDDDNMWRNRRNSSVSSLSKRSSISKRSSAPKKATAPKKASGPKKAPTPKKPSTPKTRAKPKSNQKTQKQPAIVSDDDTISYDPDLSNTASAFNIKSEPITQSERTELSTNIFSKTEIVKNVYDKNKIIENVVYTPEAASINRPQRPPKRAVAKKKKPTIQEESISDDEENNRALAPKRLPSKKRRGSNDSSMGDDDDYEKVVHKRRLFSQGRVIKRNTIQDHIKKLVGVDDDEEDQEEEEEEEEGGGGKEDESTKQKNSKETKKDDDDNNNNTSKSKNKNPEYDELRLSDDDDFPDEQEILKATGLLNSKKPTNAPKTAPLVRAPFMSSVPSYQFSMVDPTAQFEFTCLPEPSMTEPSDANHTNGDNNLSTTTT